MPQVQDKNARGRSSTSRSREPSLLRRVGPFVAFVLSTSAAAAAAYGAGCTGKDDTDANNPDGRVSAVEAATANEESGVEAENAAPAGSSPRTPSSGPAAAAGSAASAPVVDATYSGPFLGATAMQTPVYAEPRFGDDRIGYIRQGGKVPVDPKVIKKGGNCKEGWYRLLEGGYVCGKYSTTNLENPRVKLGVKQPDTSAIVPYQYAYNLHHGTPLYKSLPTRDEMRKVEPHIIEKEKEKERKKQEAAAAASGAAPSDSTAADPSEGDRPKGKHPGVESSDGNVPTADSVDATAAVAAMSTATQPNDSPDPIPEPPPEPPKPWWQSGEKNPNVSLSDLEKDAEGNLSKRMVRGFFVAVDKTLSWNDRFFYRTTSGLLAPTDRMVVNKPPSTKGIEWIEGAKEFFFTLGDKAQKYELSKDGKKMSAKGKLARFAAVALTGKTLDLDGTLYHESVESLWVKDSAGTLTAPNARPSDVGEQERWVDVNLERKTLVLFQGDKPVYAALISPGKRSRNKKKNHATPTGSWRIREKHIATTMDGDGASGDLPYSIEDVPYVAYFKGSYALHAAFWHNNFGREMSHGCVNLAPLDAKYVFNFVEPRLPTGWHGVYATKDHVGSMVVIHE